MSIKQKINTMGSNILWVSGIIVFIILCIRIYRWLSPRLQLSDLTRYLPHLQIILQLTALITGLWLFSKIGNDEKTLDFLRKNKRRSVIFFIVAVIVYYGVVEDVLFWGNALNGTANFPEEDYFFLTLFMINSSAIVNVVRTFIVVLPLLVVIQLPKRQDNNMIKYSYYLLSAICVVFLLISIAFIYL